MEFQGKILSNTISMGVHHVCHVRFQSPFSTIYGLNIPPRNTWPIHLVFASINICVFFFVIQVPVLKLWVTPLTGWLYYPTQPPHFPSHYTVLCDCARLESPMSVIPAQTFCNNYSFLPRTCSWDRKNNQHPWLKVKPDEQTKVQVRLVKYTCT